MLSCVLGDLDCLAYTYPSVTQIEGTAHLRAPPSRGSGPHRACPPQSHKEVPQWCECCFVNPPLTVITYMYIYIHYIALHCIALHAYNTYSILHAIDTLPTIHTIPYITIHCHTLPYIAIHYHTLPHITIHYHTLPYITIHYTLPYNSIQYHTALPYSITIHVHTLPYITIHCHILPYIHYIA